MFFFWGEDSENDLEGAFLKLRFLGLYHDLNLSHVADHRYQEIDCVWSDGFFGSLYLGIFVDLFLCFVNESGLSVDDDLCPGLCYDLSIDHQLWETLSSSLSVASANL